MERPRMCLKTSAKSSFLKTNVIELRNLGHLDVKENEHVLGLTNDYEGSIHILN